MMKRIIVVVYLIFGLSLMVFPPSCSSKNGESGEKETGGVQEEIKIKGEIKGRIGVTCMDLTNPFFKLISDVIRKEAAQYGYKVTSLSGENDPAKQNNQLADFVAQRYDVIFLNPVDSKSVGVGIRKAYQAGIPVFTYDVQVKDPEADKLINFHIGSDNYQGGKLAGASMMKATSDTGDIGIIGYPEISSARLRTKGFKDYLKEHNSNLKLVSELNGKAGRTAGLTAATDMLQSNPNIIGIFAINDPSALGTYSAVVKAGKTDQITIVGFDASPPGKQAVFEKKLLDSPQQFPRKMAMGIVEAFIKYLDGEKLSANIFIPCEHYYYENSLNDESRISEQW